MNPQLFPGGSCGGGPRDQETPGLSGPTVAISQVITGRFGPRAARQPPRVTGWGRQPKQAIRASQRLAIEEGVKAFLEKRPAEWKGR